MAQSFSNGGYLIYFITILHGVYGYRINTSNAELAFAPSVKNIGVPFFQYLATLTLPLLSTPITYTSSPTTAISVAMAFRLPSVKIVSLPFFQYFTTDLPAELSS